MRVRQIARLSVLSAVLVAPTIAAAGQAKPAAAKAPDKMPVSYVCMTPADAEAVSDKPGVCPNSKMEMQPVRIETAYSCITHPVVMQGNPGKCRFDGKDLVPVTVAHFYDCKDAPNKAFPDPGKCADGSARVERREIRAHGDHNPRHDGQLFMASDMWHHLEATYLKSGLVKVYFYDNFTKPLDPKTMAGRIVMLDATGNPVPGAPVPLSLSKDGKTLEARLASAPTPAVGAPVKIRIIVDFTKELRQAPFDFYFAKYSVEPAAAAPATSTARGSAPGANKPAAAPTPAAAKPSTPPPTNSSKPAPAKPTTTGAAKPPTPAAPSPANGSPANASTPAPASQEPLVLDSPLQISPALAEALDESKLPSDIPALLAELDRRVKDVESSVNEGNLSQVWLPATATKTVALVLEARATSLPERQRVIVSGAVKRVVTSAWELDAYGDLGNREKITQAYQHMAAAVTDLKAAYETH